MPQTDPPRTDPPTVPDTALREATDHYVDHRELLFSVVYGMLGTVADTEDVLQETWLAWSARHRDRTAPPVGHPRAYLVRVAVNQALARQEAVRRRRESYLGPWLPEPLVTGEDASAEVLRTESVSLALLVVLESLSPLERAVFVLREVFGYGNTEIAGILGRTPAAVRQLGRRARRHVRARRPRYEADPGLQRAVTGRFVEAALSGDVATLMEVLAPDVTMWNDGGGKVRRASRRPIEGRDRVARFLVGIATGRDPIREFTHELVNDTPAALLLREGELFAAVVLDLRGDRVSDIYTVANPDKLAHLRPSTAGRTS
ncbi:RNA polymerase sigma factor SigJ [Nocardiopsis sp. NPDC050513]|uniref:RNA polymerase sigma factor SigJ n=1 Tax=Nocardiopsis sp. NPDC050513 TaxID=3364338 RepID=UPI00378CA719